MISTKVILTQKDPISYCFRYIYYTTVRVQKFQVHGSRFYCIHKNDGLPHSSNIDTSQRNASRHKKHNMLSVSNTFTDQTSKSFKVIEELFPNPKLQLISLYNTVNVKLKIPNSMNMTYKKLENQTWECKLTVSWPREKEFTEVGKNKLLASKLVSLKCLHWLQSNRKMINGKPVLYDRDQFTDPQNKMTEIRIASDHIKEVEDLLNIYNSELKYLMTSKLNDDENSVDQNQQEELDSSTSSIVQNQKEESDSFMSSVVQESGDSYCFKSFDKPITDFDNRNKVLKQRLMRRSFQMSGLPIATYKSQILSMLEEHRKILIKGDTGCGKSTQVPQYIMDSYIQEGKATECNIIISQPRRISAISIAERIASERNEFVGDSVGYKVRLNQTLPWTPSGMLFCTTGVLLRRLQISPTLSEYSHVILDEAHERNVDTDMLLTLLKRALDLNPSLKLVVMSATLNADLFQRYFNCPVIEVPGKIYPVESHFLDDIDKMDFQKLPRTISSLTPLINFNKIVQLINWIVENTSEGAVLCFLPGWYEINVVQNALRSGPHNHRMMIIPVHAKLPSYHQQMIFAIPPAHTRKIILATDIAENGITVTDVSYVIDSAVRKEAHWDIKRNISCLSHTWISKANLKQRKGRAGRMKPGVSYHFITREAYERLPDFPIPEILRIPLEKVVLDSKTFSNEKASVFFSSMLEPPRPEVIKSAVNTLSNIGTIDQDEKLTSLGQKVAYFTLHPTLSKALVLSTIFKCVAPLLSITSSFSSDEEIFANIFENKSDIRAVKKKYHPSSDHVAVAWLYIQWFQYYIRNVKSAEMFCSKNRLAHERMKLLQKSSRTNAENLVSSYMVRNLEDCDHMESENNVNSNCDELIRGILFAGTNQLLCVPKFTFKDGVVVKNQNTLYADDGTRTLLTTESVNYKRNNWISPYLTYINRTHSEERRMALVRETSMISPLTLLLFSQSTITAEEFVDNTSHTRKHLFKIQGNDYVHIMCDEQVTEVILQFRDVLWHVVQYFLGSKCISADFYTKEVKQIMEFRDQVVDVLVKMLNDAANQIDEPEPQSDKTTEKIETTDQT